MKNGLIVGIILGIIVGGILGYFLIPEKVKYLEKDSEIDRGCDLATLSNACYNQNNTEEKVIKVNIENMLNFDRDSCLQEYKNYNKDDASLCIVEDISNYGKDAYCRCWA